MPRAVPHGLFGVFNSCGVSDRIIGATALDRGVALVTKENPVTDGRFTLPLGGDPETFRLLPG
jgi:hypothetical protein